MATLNHLLPTPQVALIGYPAWRMIPLCRSVESSLVAVSRHVVSRVLACARLVGINAGCTQQSEMEIAERLGRLSRLAPGGTYKVPSFAEDNAVRVVVVANHSCTHGLTQSHTLLLLRVLQTSGKGVVFGHKLKVRASDLTHHSCLPPLPDIILTLLSWMWPPTADNNGDAACHWLPIPACPWWQLSHSLLCRGQPA